ncbi:ribonuclease Oy [Cylas formicarius]|uniref:ribonuclease Oy n=1 Tax=Cylas formicarius TaxID=197179 RepID=UPI0029586ED2|nr:ribonuclease Oy [Cylas formicarius]
MLKEKLALNCLFIVLFFDLSRGQVYRNKPSPTPYHDWDYLIFSQRWPTTACAHWEEIKKENTCNLPKNKSLWTIHGLWPTKTGTEGPLFCPSAIHFNPDELQPLMDDLKTYWVNIEANTKPNSLWAHEWKKHGTCSVTLPQLDSVANYFASGLKFTKLYDLSRILANSGIVPNNVAYSVDAIYNVVKSALKVNPTVQCVVDAKSKESFLSEIRICLNKTLDLTDCDGQKSKNGTITNCSLKKPVWYLESVPNTYELDYNDDIFLEFQEHYERQQRYTKIYKFVKFLTWFTL